MRMETEAFQLDLNISKSGQGIAPLMWLAKILSILEIGWIKIQTLDTGLQIQLSRSP